MIKHRINRIYISVQITLLALGVWVLSTTKISLSETQKMGVESKRDFFEPVIKQLLISGADSDFVDLMIKDSRTNFDDKYTSINVIGYLSSADYSSQYNSKSVYKSKFFLIDNFDILSKAESTYGVPKEIITAVLWVETKHGGYLGNHHIVSVYLSTAMANQQAFIEENRKLMIKKIESNGEDSSKYGEYEEKLIARSDKKAKWALNELVSLSSIYKEKKLDVLSIKGSWAGAFGMSQFLPSSYLNWAVDGNSDGIINLFDKEDAIFSVANYLKVNGWSSDSEEDKWKAIYHYNNSKDYVNAILTLAKKIHLALDPDSSSWMNIWKPLNEQVN